MNPSHYTEPEWVEEVFYFGTGAYEVYRRSGDVIQRREECPVVLTERINERGFICYEGSSEEHAYFVRSYRDIKVILHPEYTTSDGSEVVPPRLFLVGWRALVTPEDLEAYHSARQSAWKPADTTP